ncbi:cytochrome b-c1 complex subunit 10 [Rhodotorula paludigena]|uniref:Cytochrome b-c1 complex subunit 10 n=1 Tax=Rhodotorula paludigena TaxID=86838 RepID=A0AAV5GWM3_9BASI|nr:hypothetical protein Rhopal_007784-T1 [Rhodotorula paludigena]
MPAPRFQPLKPGRPILGFNPQVVLRALPVVSLWGFAGVGALAVVGSAIPRFQRDVLDLVPVVRKYYVDDVPDSDKPF